MKKIFSGILAAALALTLGVSTMADSAYLTDVTPGSWYYGPVSEMVSSGVINGYEDNTFKPDRTVTVVELVTMVARITGAPYGEADGFWGGLQMDHAYRSGWISESDVSRSEPNTLVTRELACKIIAAAAGLGYPAGTVLPFTDADSVGSEYMGSVMAMYAHGLLGGFEDGTLRPQSTLTRAQAATLLYRAIHGGDAEGSAGLITAAGYSGDEIIDHFCEVALGSEYGGDGSERVIRWSEPIRYYIDGNPTDADLQKISTLAAALDQVPGFPGISEATSSANANLNIHFVDSAGMNAATAGVDEGAVFNGYVNVWWSDYNIYSGDIYYLTELTQEHRDAVIVEELCQGLGLLTDTYDYPESIFYQYHTDTAWPTTLDWAIIQLLCSGSITAGMDESAVRAAAASLVG